MADLKLDTEIVNIEKREVSGKRKKTLFSLLGFLWLFLIYSKPLNENSLYDKFGIWKGIPLVMFILLLISSGLILMYVFHCVPSKGRLTLSSDFVLLKKGKEKIEIKSREIESVRVYEYGNLEDKVTVIIELHSRKININEEVDVSFVAERNILRKLVESWQTKGIDAEITTI